MANTAKENILKKIRLALVRSTPVPFPQSEGNNSLFHQSSKELELDFAENFSSLLGRFSFCFDEKELAQQLHTLIAARKWDKIYCVENILKQTLSANSFNNFNATNLKSCDAAITSCELLIARTGSILLSSNLHHGRTASIYAPVHICVAYTNQLVYDIKDGLGIIKEKYTNHLPSLITLATGPSRTADIEKTLVVGVHGPKEVFCFLVDKT